MTSYPQVGIPTEAGLPHAFGNAFRNVAALIADIDFTFKEAGVKKHGSLRKKKHVICAGYVEKAIENIASFSGFYSYIVISL